MNLLAIYLLVFCISFSLTQNRPALLINPHSLFEMCSCILFGVCCCSPTKIIASKRELFSEKNENFWRQKNLEFILIAFSSFCYGNFSHAQEKFKPQFLLLCTLLSFFFLFTYILQEKNLDDS